MKISSRLAATKATPPGTRVRGTIYRILWDRVLVRFQSGAHGIIRQREFSWHGEATPASLGLRIGEQVEAVVLAVDAATGSLDLSVRFTERDPWADLGKYLSTGELVDATVLRVRDFGVFVELEPGVEGLIPAHYLPLESGPTGDPFHLWPEDQVRLVVKEIDLAKRHLRLSLKDLLNLKGERQLRAAEKTTGPASLGDFIDSKTLRHLLQKVGDLPQELLWPEPNRIVTVLVADDNHEFKDSLAALLREVGYVVREAVSADAALDAIEAHPCDLAILDLSLNTDSPLALADKIQEQYPNTQVLLLSGFELDNELIARAQARGFILENKPLGPQALADVLRRLEANEPTAITRDPHFPKSSEQIARPRATLVGLPRLFRQMMQVSGADSAVLFELDPQRPGRVIWSHSEGVEIQEDEDMASTLLYSPVGEVLRERRVVLVEDSAQVARRTIYLLRAVSFSSCLGVPLENHARLQQQALFLFSSTPHTFQESHLHLLEPLLRELAEVLFRSFEFDRFVNLQDELLQSRLRAGALHDIRNTLGGMEFRFKTLEKTLLRVSNGEQPADIEALLSTVLSLETYADQMHKTTSLMRDLVEGTSIAMVDVNTLIHRLIERQRLLASHLAVEVSFQPGVGVPASYMQASQIQQVADNVILNALQWCAGRQVRMVIVSTHFDGASDLPIIVRVADSGPGIHRRLQPDKIFALGFSQRKDGSGIGLFVARALMDAIGGTIAVEESIMEVGTTFRIALPHRSGSQ